MDLAEDIRVVALAWYQDPLLSFASCSVRPKAAGQMMAFMFIANVVGIPQASCGLC